MAQAPTTIANESDPEDNFDPHSDDFDVTALDTTTPPAAVVAEAPPAGGTPPGTPAAPAAPATPAASETPPAAPAAGTPAVPAVTPGAPAVPATPTAPAAPAAPTAAPVVAAPAVLPPAGPQPAAAPATAPEQTVEQALAARTQWRNDTIKTLAEKHYNLSPELIEEIQTSPEVTIPKLMARVYLDTVEAATLGIMERLPATITGIMQRAQEAEGAERDFYAAWPALNKDTHGAAVMQLATAYRQLNPSVSKEDFIKFVGSQAIVALGLTQAVAAVPAAAPAAPAAAAPGAPPFRPLASSAPATRPAQPAQVSPFAQFAEEDLAYDRGEG